MKEIVKGYCEENKCAYDVYTKDAIDNMSLAGNIFVKEGQISVPASDSATVEFEFPEGFTSDNTIVLSAATKIANQLSWWTWGMVGATTNSSGQVSAVGMQYNPKITFYANTYTVGIRNIYTSTTKYDYKVVFQKID